jgi:hypothetical protein
MVDRIGGSFAPPLDAEKVSAYRKMAKNAPAEIKEVMVKLCDMMDVYQKSPKPKVKSKGTAHPSGKGTIVPLTEEQRDAIFEAVPWEHENQMYADLFETIPNDTHKPLRDAAFHLLWYAIELEKDREPITCDQL